MRQAPARARPRAAARRRHSVATRTQPLPGRLGRQVRAAMARVAPALAPAEPVARAAVPEAVARAEAAPELAARTEAVLAQAAAARTAARRTPAAAAPAHAIGRHRPPTYRRGSTKAGAPSLAPTSKIGKPGTWTT